MTTQILASLQLFHSRPIAPTRRVALGELHLPTDPAPGPGGVLLGGVIANYAPALDEDTSDDLEVLLGQLERGMRVVQPRLRHRLQADRVGLLRADHQLISDGDGLRFRFSGQGSPLVYMLGAVYAAATVAPTARTAVFGSLRKGLYWRGSIGPGLIAHLGGRGDTSAWEALGEDPVVWALRTLGLDPGEGTPARDVIRRQFRHALRDAHPDHGGAEEAAAQRIAALTAARRILLG
jgi:hypothetical protein